jgi:hypothetical protein
MWEAGGDSNNILLDSIRKAAGLDYGLNSAIRASHGRKRLARALRWTASVRRQDGFCLSELCLTQPSHNFPPNFFNYNHAPLYPTFLYPHPPYLLAICPDCGFCPWYISPWFIIQICDNHKMEWDSQIFIWRSYNLFYGQEASCESHQSVYFPL